jgi:hypothetical protein
VSSPWLRLSSSGTARDGLCRSGRRYYRSSRCFKAHADPVGGVYGVSPQVRQVWVRCVRPHSQCCVPTRTAPPRSSWPLAQCLGGISCHPLRVRLRFMAHCCSSQRRRTLTVALSGRSSPAGSSIHTAFSDSHAAQVLWALHSLQLAAVDAPNLAWLNRFRLVHGLLATSAGAP